MENSQIVCLKYRFQFNGDPDSCIALADLLRVGWELVNVDPLQTADGFHWIKLQRYVRREPNHA